MVVDFSNINYQERPLLILKNASEQVLGYLGYAKNRELELNYSSVSTLRFELPAEVDGKPVPFYDDVTGLRIVEIPHIGQFIINQPEDSGNETHREKSVEAYSLENEFARKKITLGEGTYRFYDPTNQDNSLLSMIMELMPAWRIGSVPDVIKNRYRTFSVENQNLYDLMMNTIQDTYGCLFEFDTLTRTVYVRDVKAEPAQDAVWLSEDNLIKELTITEDTDNLFTRLDVNGADGVDIRDVNPDGTNKIVNLDYFMTTDNFPQALIDKYYAWKTLYANNRESYYNLSIRYTLLLSQRVAESANLTDLRNEYINLDNQRAVTIQAIAQGLQTQSDLNTINGELASAQAKVDAKEAEIATIENDLVDIMTQLTAIKNQCNFKGYFTEAEWRQLDRYIIDGDVTENTFVAESVGAYMDEGNGATVTNCQISFDGVVSTVTDAVGRQIYRLGSGVINISGILYSNLISGTVEYYQGKLTGSAYLNAGTINGQDFVGGCVTFTGDGSNCSARENTDGNNDGRFDATLTGYVYFTYDVSEYQRRSVAWDLYEYGVETLDSLSQPSYSFSVDSANFLALDEFIAFKNALTLGQRIYLQKKGGSVVYPVLVGATLNLDDMTELSLEFGDKYTKSNPAQKLVDLLGKSVSMGKNVETGKYVYSSFKDSGAALGIKSKILSALDVSKNQIIDSSGQAVSWDGSGLHLRKWNATQTGYDPEQIWFSNNMIAMTDDNWATAKMAIGKFTDSNAGACWGIVAPMVMGTLLAGNQLIIESEKKSGGTAVFRMDGDGCRLYNTDFTVSRTVTVDGVLKTTQISINPDFGIAIGDDQLYTTDAQTGVKTLQPAHAKFYADDSGNLHLTGAVSATSLMIENQTAADYITQFAVDDNHIKAVIGSTYTYLTTSGISMSGETIALTGGSISLTSSNGNNNVTVNDAGVSITGGSISLSGNGAINLVSGGNANISLSPAGITMSAGYMKVDATDNNNDSYIRFGGTPSVPNFKIGYGGHINAKSGSFETISVENHDVVMCPTGYTAPGLVVSGTQPGGSNILWLQPSSVSYTDYTFSGSGYAINDRGDLSATIPFTRGGSALAGNEVKYGIKFSIYCYGGNSYRNNSISVQIRPSNSSDAWTTIVNGQDVGQVLDGDTVNIDTLLSPVAVSNNMTTAQSIDVKVTFVRSGVPARFANNVTFTLRCSNNTTANVQACNVYYIM